MKLEVSTSAPRAVAEQTGIVRQHFNRVCGQWAARYDAAPRRMSDLDLLLRRENAQRLLAQAVPQRPSEPARSSDPPAAGRPPRLLDVGCGPANLLDGWGGPPVEYHGVDLSPEMIAEARRRRPDGRFQVGSATGLPLADGSMDVVVCLGVLEYLDGPDAALGEIRRVLRDGGALIVSFPNRASLLRRLGRAQARLERRLAGALRRARGRAGELLAPPYRHCDWTPPQALALLRRAGFEPCCIRFNTYGLGGRIGRWWPSLWVSRALSRRAGGDSPLARRMAGTMIVLARRAGVGTVKERRA